MARNPNKISKKIDIGKDDFEWYLKVNKMEDTDKTGFSALMCLLLHSYRTICENPLDFPVVSINSINLTIEAAKLARDEEDSS